MKSYFFDLDHVYKISDKENLALNLCLFNLSKVRNIATVFDALLGYGGLGGDGGWFISRWNSLDLEEKNFIKPFEGFGYFITSYDGDLEHSSFSSEEDLRMYVKLIADNHIVKYPEEKNIVVALLKQYEIKEIKG